MDYYALKSRLNADLADYATLDETGGQLVRLAKRLSKDTALALYGFFNRDRYDVIYSNGENVSIPLNALFMLVGHRPSHVLIGHHLSTPKKRLFLRSLAGKMDSIFVYADTQRHYGLEYLRIPEQKLHLIPFHADHRFYHPMASRSEKMICSAGLEWRDYPTLISAVEGLDIEVKLAAASPWSHHNNETENRELPHNVSARRYEYAELRELYASSAFVVVPLYENDFQAGVTTILEAMAMGKAVIVTRTIGQKDVIIEGENGLYVPPGDAAALRTAITHLLENPEEARRLGENGRKTIEQNMSLDHWVDRIANVIEKVAA